MSLQDIYDALNNSLHEGEIVLSAATVRDLDLTLEAIGITGTKTLTLTNAALTLGPRSVVLIGTAAYRDFAWSTTLTGEPVLDSKANRFILRMQGQDASMPWTFGTSFPDLPQSRTIKDLTLPLVDSVLSPLVVEQPVLTVQTEPPRPERVFKASFEGWLVLTGSALAEYIVYFAAPKLHLAGTIDFFDPTHPVLVLWAAAPGAQIVIPVLSIVEVGSPISISEVGIKLQSDAEDIYSLEEIAVNSAVEVYANISFGKAVRITAQITTPLLQGNFFWQLRADFEEPI